MTNAADKLMAMDAKSARSAYKEMRRELEIEYEELQRKRRYLASLRQQPELNESRIKQRDEELADVEKCYNERVFNKWLCAIVIGHYDGQLKLGSGAGKHGDAASQAELERVIAWRRERIGCDAM